MKCPFCGLDDTRVIDSRPADDNTAIRRRRHCPACNRRFTTYEKAETLPLVVIKKDNTRELYNRSKIEDGIIRSCHKRPISTEQIRAIVDDVENTIFNSDENEIPTTMIGELVMAKLKKLDAVAYVRFASVYRAFDDVGTFIDEINRIDEDE